MVYVELLKRPQDRQDVGPGPSKTGRPFAHWAYGSEQVLFVDSGAGRNTVLPVNMEPDKTTILHI